MITTRKHFSLLVVFFLLTIPLFAQMPRGMTTLAENILEIFTSKFIQVIFAIFFCGAAVAYGFNKDNEKIKRNCIAIGIASGMICAASGIVEALWSASSG
jgi:hypothetical protein